MKMLSSQAQLLAVAAIIICSFLTAPQVVASETVQRMFDGLEACIAQYASPENMPVEYRYVEPLKKTCSSCTSQIGKVEKLGTGATAVVETSSDGGYPYVCTPDLSFASNPDEVNLVTGKYVQGLLDSGLIIQTEKFGNVVCSPDRKAAVILELPRAEPKILYFLARFGSMEEWDKEC